MKAIYLESKDEYRIPRHNFTIDKIPPKSTYKDRNRSDIVASETFQSPSDEVLKKLHASARKFFEK